MLSHKIKKGYHIFQKRDCLLKYNVRRRIVSELERNFKPKQLLKIKNQTLNNKQEKSKNAFRL